VEVRTPLLICFRLLCVFWKICKLTVVDLGRVLDSPGHRVYILPKYGIVPASILEDLASKAPNFDKWAREVIKHPSVLCIWDEEKIVEGTRGWIGKMRGKV
jgi:hypothetical protein